MFDQVYNIKPSFNLNVQSNNLNAWLEYLTVLCHGVRLAALLVCLGRVSTLSQTVLVLLEFKFVLSLLLFLSFSLCPLLLFTTTTGIHFIKLFFPSSLTAEDNKLECFAPASLLQDSLKFASMFKHRLPERANISFSRQSNICE